MTITKDFEGANGTLLSSYDAKFNRDGGTSGHNCQLNGSGQSVGNVSSQRSRWSYNDSQTGLDQTSKIVAQVKESASSAGTGPCVHIGGGQTGLGILIVVSGSDIGACTLRSISSDGQMTWVANIGNPTISGGANRDVEYEIIAHDAGGGNVDIDCRIDGTLYSNVVTGRSQSAGIPGFVQYSTQTLVESMTVTAGTPAVVAPTWGTVTLPTVAEGEGWTTDLNTFITDDGGEAPTFSIASGALPAGITLNSNGTFSGTADPGTAGNGAVTFTATNSGGSNDSNNAAWEVTGPGVVTETHTIRFSAAVTYTGANPTGGPVEGVSFERNGTPAQAVRHSTNMGTPSDVIAYEVDYPTATVAGDAIIYQYTPDGAYEDAGGLKLPAYSEQVENCAGADPVPDTPVIDQVVAGDSQVTINYSHPGPYNYAEFFDSGVTMNAFDNDADRSKVIVGLNNGQTYDISMRVYSPNDFTPSAFSNELPGTPQGTAPAPPGQYNDGFDNHGDGTWSWYSSFEGGVVGQLANEATSGITCPDHAGTRALITDQLPKFGSKCAVSTLPVGSFMNYDLNALGWSWLVEKGVTVGEGIELWVRFFVKINTGFPYTKKAKLSRLRTDNCTGIGVYPGDDTRSRVWMYINSSNSPYGDCTLGEYWDNNDLGNFPENAELGGLFGETWEAVELYAKYSHTPGNAITRVWRNGTLEIEDKLTRNLFSPTDRVRGLTLAFFTTTGSSAESEGKIWLDDIVITTKTPGNTDAAGNAFIGTGIGRNP